MQHRIHCDKKSLVSFRRHGDAEPRLAFGLPRKMDFRPRQRLLHGVQQSDQTFELHMTVGEVLEILGEDNVKTFVQQKTAAAAYKPEYDRSTKNILGNWLMLGMFILVFAALSTIVLELIDKDKR